MSQTLMYERVIVALFPHPEELTFERLEPFGVSGMTPGLDRVFIVRDVKTGRLYAIKAGERSRGNTIKKQMKNRDLLAHAGGKILKEKLPQVRFFTDELPEPIKEAMAMEYFSEWNLSDAVVRGVMNDQAFIATWHDILATFTQLWMRTKKPWNKKTFEAMTRHPVKRAESVEQHTLSCVLPEMNEPLRAFIELPIVIEEKKYPSLRSAFEKMRAFDPPRFSVTCHNDLNCDNLVVKPNGEWAVIDWEWVSECADWRMSLSHLIGWWWANTSRQIEAPSAVVQNGKLVLTSSLELSSVCYHFMHNAFTAGAAYRKKTNESKKWREQVHRYLATLFIGEMRFAHPRGRDAYTIDLLALGIKALYSPELLFPKPK